MGKIITISSGKGGTGKTTAVAAIGSCLAALGKKTLCIDFDAQLQNLDLSLCIKQCSTQLFIDALNSEKTILDASRPHPRIQNLYYITAPEIDELKKHDREKIKAIGEEIKRDFDFCVIDAPSGIGSNFELANEGADLAIVVTTTDLHSLRDIEPIERALKKIDISEVRFILNRATKKGMRQLQTLDGAVGDTIHKKLIGVVPEDKFVFRTIHDHVPLVLYHKRFSAYHFLDIARRIAGEQVPWRIRFDVPQFFDHALGEYGNPKLWAKSTLNVDNPEGLILAYVCHTGTDLTKETIRHRFWIHDLLDDAGIPYYVEVKPADGSKMLVESQRIYVEENNKTPAKDLIFEYQKPSSIVTEERDGGTEIMQKECPSCDTMIDFDYHKCPNCKKTF